MGKSRTPAQAAKQSARTYENKKRKYLKLIKEKPTDHQVSIWQDKLNKLK